MEAKIKQQLSSLGISENDLTIEKEIAGRGTFKIKALFPYEKTYVVKLIAEQAGNVSNLFVAEADYVRKICTLLVCIEESPDWFTGAENCIDDDLLEELYQTYNKLDTDLQERLKKNRPSGKPDGVGNKR